MKNRKLLILGGSGDVGQQSVRIAKYRGYQITVLVRSETNYEKQEGIDVVQGSVLDADVLEQVMKGKDLVLSCLGPRKENPSNPWSTLISPANFAQDTAQNIVKAMKSHGVKRLVAISAAGVGDSLPAVTPVFRLVIRKSNLGIL